MNLSKWKFYFDKKDFFYYRESDGYIAKVYPVFSFCLLKGPKEIIYWLFDFEGEVAKSKNSLELMIYADMKLIESGDKLDGPFNPFIEDEDSAMNRIKKEFKDMSNSCL